MAEETRLTQSSDVARIRADIETTRAQMSDTLSQIQERLSPARLKEQARESVREATIGRVKQMARNAGDKAGEAGRSIMDVVRDNPLPLAMIGLGAGWLLMSSRRRGRVEYHHDVLLTERTPVGYESGYSNDHTRVYGQTSTPGSPSPESAVERARETVSERAHEMGDRAHEMKDRVTHRMTDVGESVRERAGEIRETAQQRISGAAARLGDVATGIRGRVGDTAGALAERSQLAATRASQRYQETPWVGAAVALGLGVAAGLAIPETAREHELMGDRRDQLLGRARALGREKIDAVRNVASEVIADAKDSVRQTAQSLREDLSDSVREHAREEGLAGTNGTGESAGSSYSSGSSA